MELFLLLSIQQTWMLQSTRTTKNSVSLFSYK
jgi:hypothetical protein